jgi:hypothetical protein
MRFANALSGGDLDEQTVARLRKKLPKCVIPV